MTAFREFRGRGTETGFSARNPVPGPEFDLVQLFARHLADVSRETHTHGIALFYEPHVAGCFPDLVIAEFDYRRFQDWSSARAIIGTADIRVLNHLHRVEQAGVHDLCDRLGFARRSVERSLNRLEGANLVVQREQAWVPLPLERVFGLTRLVAIEAKVDDWRGAFRQAEPHRYFASECFVLLPARRKSCRLLDEEQYAHIGILFCNEHELEVARPSECRKLPASHASWMFNEWLGRSLHGADVRIELE
jgi:hypothetical protein